MNVAYSKWPTRSSKILAWLGALPFVIALVVSLSSSRLQYWPFIVVLMSTYSALIVTYIAGSHWGIVMQSPETVDKKFIIYSHILTLFAWMGILFPSWLLSWGILLTCFWVVYAIDYRFMQLGCMTKNYLNMRLQITSVVSICLLSMMFIGRHQL